MSLDYTCVCGATLMRLYDLLKCPECGNKYSFRDVDEMQKDQWRTIRESPLETDENDLD